MLINKDKKMINQYFTSSIGDGKLNIKVQFDEESEDALPTGKETIKQDESAPFKIHSIRSR